MARSTSGEQSKGKSVAPSETSPTSHQYGMRQYPVVLDSTFTSSGFTGPGGQKTWGGVSQPCPLVHIRSRRTCTRGDRSEQEGISGWLFPGLRRWMCRAGPAATALQTISVPSINMFKSISSLYYLYKRLRQHIVTAGACCSLPAFLSTHLFLCCFFSFSLRSSLFLSVSHPLIYLTSPFPL